jgi:uncharacterized phage protein (TIGR02218 family)
MTFAAYEESIEDGMPIFLYRFTLNDKVWRFTSADGDITTTEGVWTAVPIADDGVKQTGESATDALTITASSAIAPVELYIHYPPSSKIQVAILTFHQDDLGVNTVYVGEVTQVNVPTPGTAVLTCETLSSSLKRAGLRYGWQRTCPYALYDEITCKVDKTLWGVPAIITSIVDAVLTAPALAPATVNRYAGGFLEWTDPVRGIERKAIENSSIDGQLTIFGSMTGLEVGLNIIVYPGCLRTLGACSSFNNLVNYGGVPSMPGWSPFDGTPVFY